MKKKIKSRAIYILSIIICLSLSFCLFASTVCAYNEGNTEEPSGEETAVQDAPAAEGNNVFESLYELFLEYIGEIMCALTLIGSLILTILYKRGLMPFMTRTAGAIGSTIAGIRESTDSLAQRGGAELERMNSALGKAEQTMGELASRLETIEGALKSLGADTDDKALFKAAVECQSSLLYEILMNSSIPQYQKDAVGERLGAIRSALAKNEGGGCEK